MTKLAIVASALAIMTLSVPTESSAQSRCPAGLYNCNWSNAHDKIRTRVNEGAREVLTNDSKRGRVKAVGETIRDCINCGLDTLSNGWRNPTGRGNATR